MPIQDAPQVGTQHAVPQNVMDVEFKLIGDMTLRQFAYLLICGISAYVCYTTIVGIFKWPLVIIFTVLGIGLAFVPIQDRGMDEWVMNFVNAMFLPTQRVWKKEPMIPQAFLYQSIDVVKQELITLAPTSSRRKLEKYLDYGINEAEEDPLDIPEEEYIMKVKRAFAVPDYVQSQPIGVSAAAAVSTVTPPPEPSLETFQVSPPEEPQVEEPRKEELPTEEIPLGEGSPVEVEVTEVATEEQPSVEDFGEEKGVFGKEEEEKVGTLKVMEEEYKEPPVIPVRPEPTDASVPQMVTPLSPPMVQLPPSPSLVQPPPRPRRQDEFLSVDLMTPDRHSGRRFTQLLPQEGDIFLPIRGERVLKTAFQQEIDVDVKEKAEKLQMLLEQIRRGDMAGVVPAPQTPQAPQVPQIASGSIPLPAETAEDKREMRLGVKARQAADRLKEENDQLSSEIDRLKNEITQSSGADTAEKEGLLKQLEVQREKAQGDYERLHRQVTELQQRLKEKQEVAKAGGAPRSVRDYKIAATQITSKPNVLSGVVKDNEGAVLDGVLLIVKDSRGDPVRAFKTNKLGEFILATPLDNGMYTIEVSSVNDIELSFDIISVEAKGEVIPPVEIIGA
ncbi:PrgI family protein [Patescibacteria group bacterium]|nr:PrgI family protein [Patescibacteria group bacterium]